MGKTESSISPPPLLQPLLFLSPPPPLPPSSTSNLDSKISPSILLIIIILAIIFFVSGLLHLLVRCLLRPATRIRDPDGHDAADPTVLQGQLRQLFHLHDGGVDQSFIDTLPVFPYKAILGVKDPFDCAVCLCEFEAEDKLRLLPKCSHAFHVECIDTWLLSHSTCPLCRFSLLNGFNGGGVGANGGSNVGFPFVCVLESSRDMGDSVPVPVPDSDSNPGQEGEVGSGLGLGGLGLGLGLGGGSGRVGWDLGLEGRRKEEGERIVTVKLGKFRNVDGGEGSSENNNNDGNGGSNGNLGSRRCFSMGSFAYVLDETMSLHVPIRTPAKKKQVGKKPALPLKPGYSAAMSEYGSDSMREFDALKSVELGKGKLHAQYENRDGNGNVSGRSKRESFSISKIWMRGGGEKGKKAHGSSSRRTISEIEIDASSVELGLQSQRFGGDEETQSCYSVDSLANPRPSTSNTSTKRTLLWLMGRNNNKIAHNHSSSFSSNV